MGRIIMSAEMASVILDMLAAQEGLGLVEVPKTLANEYSQVAEQLMQCAATSTEEEALMVEKMISDLAERIKSCGATVKGVMEHDMIWVEGKKDKDLVVVWSPTQGCFYMASVYPETIRMSHEWVTKFLKEADVSFEESVDSWLHSPLKYMLLDCNKHCGDKQQTTSWLEYYEVL